MMFPEKLIALRNSRNWSQKELAEALSVSVETVARWENGQAVPTHEELLSLSKLFGVTADYLFGDGALPQKKESQLLFSLFVLLYWMIVTVFDLIYRFVLENTNSSWLIWIVAAILFVVGLALFSIWDHRKKK